MNKSVLSITYEHIDRWIESIQPNLLQEEFACIVGILRGGGPVALMTSHATGVPVAFLRYDRKVRRVSWDSSIPLPTAGSKVLLCEDIAGVGNTLSDCHEYLRDRGLTVRILTVGFDDKSAIHPDYGILLPDIDAQYYEANLEEALLKRDALAPYSGLPARQRVKAIITGRPEMDRGRTLNWLSEHGFEGIELIMRDPSLHDDSPNHVAQHKAQAALDLTCTHFVESDAIQAMLIAAAAPLLRVIWWDATEQKAHLVGCNHLKGFALHSI